MKGIKVFVEGGGDSVHQRRELRVGFDELLAAQKMAAQGKKRSWDTTFRGGRDQTFDAFHRALEHADDETLLILLVDSEDGIDAETKNAADANAQTRVQHLTQRDQWDLTGTDPKQVHLMVQCMETWIVADAEALADYYGKGFHAKSLPKRQNLEEEPKPDVLDKLKKATNKTQKGEYAKIKHASKLLACIDPAKVRQRCSRFATFTAWLTKEIGDS